MDDSTRDELLKRIEKLEREVERGFERTRLLNETISMFAKERFDLDGFDKPLTEAEIEDMLHGPRGESLDDIIADYQQLLAGA